MRSALLAGLTAMLVIGCGGKVEPGTAAGPGAESPTAAAPTESATSGADVSVAPPAATGDSSPTGMNGRTGELQNPDNNVMVLLYYDLAGIKPPVDQWVEKDFRLVMAQAIDKAALRQTIRAEIEAGMASVRNVGLIRITLGNANLSDYDPTYGEFTIRALSPSSEIPFSAFDRKVVIRFANGRTAQIWKVPAAEVQAIRDKVGYSGGGYPNVEIDLLLRIKSAVSSPGDGVIMTDILEYEMRNSRGGDIIHRAQVAP
jgi:hypothetical protein